MQLCLGGELGDSELMLRAVSLDLAMFSINVAGKGAVALEAMQGRVRRLHREDERLHRLLMARCAEWT